ncbi:MAG: DUF721 domain-containing protein [Actinomycetota bacterium]
MADLMRLLVAGRGWGERMAVQQLAQSWEQIVGPHVAEHSEPLRLIRGVLTIRAERGVWATELTLLAASIAEKADRFLGSGSVREARVQTAGPGPHDHRG